MPKIGFLAKVATRATPIEGHGRTVSKFNLLANLAKSERLLRQ